MPRSSAALRFTVIATGLLVAAASMRPAPASAQSFDCRNARYADEKLICREPGLAQLDQDLATRYRRQLGNLAKDRQDEFQHHEIFFLNARRRCGDNYGCIEQSYRNRIQELDNLVSAEAAQPPAAP